jgi:hypothetical protein
MRWCLGGRRRQRLAERGRGRTGSQGCNARARRRWRGGHRRHTSHKFSQTCRADPTSASFPALLSSSSRKAPADHCTRLMATRLGFGMDLVRQPLRLFSAVTLKFFSLYLTHVSRQHSLPSISPPCTVVPLKPSPIPHYNHKISFSIPTFHIL